MYTPAEYKPKKEKRKVKIWYPTHRIQERKEIKQISRMVKKGSLRTPKNIYIFCCLKIQKDNIDTKIFRNELVIGKRKHLEKDFKYKKKKFK